MPVPILPEGSKFDGTFIRRVTIIKMVQNFINDTFKRDKSSGNPRKVDKDADSHAIWYSKKEIDQLFELNKVDGSEEGDGIRIYLALHNRSAEEVADMPNRLERYIGHHTVILVCTRHKVDLLDENKNFIADPGTGLEEGELCPPPKCGTLDDRLTP